MKPFLYERLARALLVEMASGLYAENGRFLSLRQIRRLWNVSEPTARSSVALLEEEGLLQPVARSGYRLEAGFQKRALLLLHTSPETTLPPQSSWRDKRWRMLRAAKEDSSRRIGLILEDTEEDATLGCQSDLAALEATRTFFQDANRDGCDVLYFYQDGKQATEDFILTEIERSQLDAIVIFRRFRTERFSTFLKRLASCRIPLVTVFGNYEQGNAFSINFNNIGAGFSAARLLLESGHRRIVALVPPRQSENFDQRLQGFFLGFSERTSGDELPSVETVRLPSEGESLEEIREGLRAQSSRPTAIFAPGISTFVQLKHRAREQGWRIPHGIRILGCGNPALLPKRDRNVEILFLDFPEAGRRAYRYVRKILDGSPVERMSLLPVPYLGTGLEKKKRK